MRNLTEIRIAGFGGQGVILSAIVIGKAGCIYEDGYSTMTQAFGPEARGGACSAQVILSNEPILYPYVTQADILVTDVAGGVHAVHAAAQRERTAHHRAGPGARRCVAAGSSGIQRSRHAAGRRAGQAHGAEHRDGRLLRSSQRSAQAAMPSATPSPTRCRRRSSS